MPRDITITFNDGTTHTYKGAPDDVTPDAVQARAEKEFSKEVTALDGGRAAAPASTNPLDQIPGQVRRPAEPDASEGWRDRIMGAIETPFALASGAVAGPVKALAGVAGAVASGKYGTQEGVAAGQRVADTVGNQFYQPRTETARNALAAVGGVTENLMGVPMGTLGDLGRAAPPAIRALKDNTRAVVNSPLPFGQTVEAQAAATAAKNQAASFRDAGRIDAATEGNKIGLVGDPGAMNPTVGNKVSSRVTDPKLITAAAARKNDAQLSVIAKKEMGLPENTALTDAAAFDKARELASGPYREAAAIPTIVADEATVAKIRGLTPSEIAGRGAEARRAAGEINLVVEDLRNGISGKKALDTISAFRKDARSILNSEKLGQPLTAAQRDMAAAYRGMADAMEDMIASTLKTDPRFAERFNAARTQLAKIEAYEDATNFGTGKIDPKIIAKQTKDNPRLTGDIATIGKFTNNFPEAMGIVTPETAIGTGIRHLSRASVGGTIGAAIGAMTPVGPIGGGAMGVGAGTALSRLNAARIVSPSYQAKNAIPTDYRPPVNNLRPVTPNSGSNVVPYDWSQSVTPPPPNWTIPRPPPTVTTSPEPMTTPRLGAPSAEGTMSSVAAERARKLNTERAMAEDARVKSEQASAASRKPASGEILFDVDPVTGKLVRSDSTVKGATPNVQVIENTGKSLSSAAEKITSGKQFSFTAEERIAWNKTKVDMAEADPGLKGLSDKAVAGKMMDRQWIADTIKNLREKDRVFNALAEQSSARRAASDVANAAALRREQLINKLTELEEQLRPNRPSKSGSQQGPKTRQFQRNELARNNNALAE